MLPEICERLSNQGFAVESDGALVIEVEGSDVPLMLRKKDGGYG